MRLTLTIFLSWIVLATGCGRAQIETNTDKVGVDPGEAPAANGKPVHHPAGDAPPAESANSITVISVPAIVTEQKARYVGEVRGDIRPADKPVPLSVGGNSSNDGSGHQSLAIAAAFLGWDESRPLPAGAEVLYSTTHRLAASPIIDNDLMTFPGTLDKPISLGQFNMDGVDAEAAYDEDSQRFLVFAVARTEDRTTGIIQLAVSAAAGDTNDWYLLPLDGVSESKSDRVFIDLVAQDLDSLYLRTSGGSKEVEDSTVHAVWIVSKLIYRGESPVVTRVAR